MPVSGILGKKIGMTQVFDDNGEVHPITVLQAGPCVVTQLKTATKDGYDAAQIGLVEFVKASKVTSRRRAFCQAERRAGEVLRRKSRSKLPSRAPAKKSRNDGVKAGDRVLVDIFSDDKYVDVTGTSKGAGFAGVVRRHHFGGGPSRTGTCSRWQGSIGASSFPSRVFPGQRMPGHMGVDRVTVRNLRIRGIDLDENLIMVEGRCGPSGCYVLIRSRKLRRASAVDLRVAARWIH